MADILQGFEYIGQRLKLESQFYDTSLTLRMLQHERCIFFLTNTMWKVYMTTSDLLLL